MPTVPVDTAAQLTESGAVLMLIEQVVVPTALMESVTWSEKAPRAVGVPVTAPVELFSVKPAGNAPTTEYAYGAVPPETVSAPELNATPTVPAVVAGQVTERAALMVIGQVLVATLPWLSVALRVNVPAAVGVPVRTPVVALSVSPAGSVPVATA